MQGLNELGQYESKGLELSELIDRCHFGDCLDTLRLMPAGIAHTCVTSPPYFGQRDYKDPRQIGLEVTPAEYVAKLVAVFREVRRVLRDDGTLWLNLGDSYGTNTKQLLGIPWKVAFALQDDGWVLRQDIIWHKSNAMPEKVRDRCTNAHEYIFLLAKFKNYYFDHEAMQEPVAESSRVSTARELNPMQSSFETAPRLTQVRLKVRARTGKNALRGQGHFSKGGTVPANRSGRDMQEIGGDSGMRNKRSVWRVATTPYAGSHLATFPSQLIEPCILAGAPVNGVVLDPFFGTGTTGEVAQSLGRSFIGCELDAAYEPVQKQRLGQRGLKFEEP